MNSRQAAQYARGLETAQRDMLEVRGHGTVKATGAAVYAVPSRSQQNTWHLVVVNGLELTCDCTAGKFNRYCCHRAAVRARLILEGQVRQDAREREIERAFHSAAAALNVKLNALGPKPADSVKPFSVCK